MTLIVGLKTKNTAILGVDTQVSRKNRTGSVDERTLLHKLNIFSNSIFSYLGTWDINEDNTLDNFRTELNKNKFKYLYAKSFVKKLDRDSALIGFVKIFGIVKFIFLGKKLKT